MPQESTASDDAHPHGKSFVVRIALDGLHTEVEDSPHEILLLFILSILLILKALISLTKIPEIMKTDQLFAGGFDPINFHAALAKEVFVLPVDTREACVKVLWDLRVANHSDVLWENMIEFHAVILIFELSDIKGADIPKRRDALISPSTPRVLRLIYVFVARNQTSPLQCLINMMLNSVLSVLLHD